MFLLVCFLQISNVCSKNTEAIVVTSLKLSQAQNYRTKIWAVTCLARWLNVCVAAIKLKGCLTEVRCFLFENK